jgi:hypothetical protein
MTLTVRLPPHVEEELKQYCVARRISKSGAVKQALARLLSEVPAGAAPFDLGKDGFGTDASPRGDIARHTKRLIRERFRGAPRR